MGMHVDVERGLPLGLGGAEVGADGDPGVGEEQIDRPEHVLGGSDEDVVACLGTHVDGKCDCAARADGVELIDDGGQALCVDIRRDDSGAFGVESPGQGATDPVGSTGDNDVTSIEFH